MPKYVKLFEDLLPGGIGDDRPDSEFDPEQLRKGSEDEGSEHTNDPRIAKEIAKDHLSKDPNYYANEDVGGAIAGAYADTLKQFTDTKTAAIEDAHAVEDPKAGGIGRVQEALPPDHLKEWYRQQRMQRSSGKIKEDTTNPDAAGDVDPIGQELRSNDDLSNQALPISYNENKTNRMQTNEKQSAHLKHKMKKVMGEFGKGTLKTSAGKKVTDPKQAVAIGYSEAGESKNEGVGILRFEQFVNEKYGPEQEKLEKDRQKKEQELASTADKAGKQKELSGLRKKITKNVVAS